MKRKLAVATATVLSLAFPTAIANAAPDPTTGVELGVSQSQFSALQAQFNPSLARTEGLRAVRQLREEMWNLNPYLSVNGSTGTKLRDVVQAKGWSKTDYISNVSIDSDLTWMAIQRASEQVHRFEPAHTRPNGGSIWDATRNGRHSNGEILMTGTGVTLSDAIVKYWGHGELRALNASKGEANAQSGHLHTLINPENTYYGFGRVSGRKNGQGSVDTVIAGLSGVAPAKALANESNTPNKTYNTWLYNAAGDRRDVTGVKDNAPGQFPSGITNPGGTSGSSGDIGMIIGIILGVVSILGSIWMAIQQFLPR